MAATNTKKLNSFQSQTSKMDLIISDIHYIEDFFEMSDDNGILKGFEAKSCKYDIIIDTPTTKQDAYDIRTLIEITYQGTYPFLEMYDLHFIISSFKDNRFKWIVFRMNSEDSPDYGHIIFSWLWVIDYEKRIGYNRCYNLNPKYHGKIPIRDLTYKSYRDLMLNLRATIDKWYYESRTAHSKSQAMGHGLGCHTQALFLNKDYFMGKKESDAMMCAYFRESIEEKRIPPKMILPEIQPIYAQAMHIHNQDMSARIQDLYPQIDYMRAERIIRRIKRRLIKDRHQYIHFTFVDERTCSYLKGLHTITVNNIEKITYHCTDPDVLYALFRTLEMYTKVNRIEYMEWRVPVSDLFVQKIILKKMIPLGYVPAWINSKKEKGKFEDMVVFGWMDRDIQLDNLKLTHEGISLLDLIDLERIHKQIISDLPTFAQWDYKTLHVATAFITE